MALLTTPPRPAPLRAFICKVASRCDLDCDYCYVYQHPDQSWRNQPTRMSLQTAALLGRRIQEHARRHGLAAVDVIFHGGEPLIVGLQHLAALCDVILSSASSLDIRFRMQTNGVLFDQETLTFCRKYNVTVGLSCDGPRQANDRHRRDHFGRSSFDNLYRAIQLLSSDDGQPIWSGFLAVIDVESDPIEVYDFLRSFRPKSIEFLLPLANHDRPPIRLGSETPYAQWLLTVFHRWYRENPQTTIIRRFRDVIGLLAGIGSSSEEWGLQPVDFAVIESNGELQVVDTLKSAFEGANHLGLNLQDHTFDDMLHHPLVIERQAGSRSLCEVCQRCPLVKVCAGGYFPHRFKEASGFNNPSVYCQDLQVIIRSIHTVVSDDLRRLQGERSERNGVG